MTIIGWIVFGLFIFFLAKRNDEKMDENFMNMAIRLDYLENRIHDLEISNRNNDETIKYQEKTIRDMSERIFELEKPYQKSFLDD
ncbi:hypothetical protein J0904_02230 [Acinetobacter bereziniae]|uniref:hypothetical protein n=1 Tax=Acinetobacter bereziniae TaxID=106648 RepID=UPI0020759ADF|nr:hypothetical protein [Acinetobacter bereziniae]MCM8510906.1 hypothetical protein [Acinetobacter bereziniae]